VNEAGRVQQNALTLSDLDGLLSSHG
jgi:hypothetical protein